MKYLLFPGFDVQLEYCDNLSLVALMICLNYSISPVFTIIGFHSVGSLIMFLSNNGRVPFSFFLDMNMVTCSKLW